MNDRRNAGESEPRPAQERKAYEPPKLVRLGTLRELTLHLPGVDSNDGDPINPGSSVP